MNYFRLIINILSRLLFRNRVTYVLKNPEIRVLLRVRAIIPSGGGSSNPRRGRSVVVIVWARVKSKNGVGVNDGGGHLSSRADGERDQ